MTKFSLEAFRVPSENLLKVGDDLKVAHIVPVREMLLLKFIADDESTQHKAFNYMFDNRVGLGLRGFSDSETSHPAWNCFRKSVTKAGMTIDLMKLTLCCYSIQVSVSLYVFSIQSVVF